METTTMHIAVHLAKVYAKPDAKSELLRTLAWGDRIEVKEQSPPGFVAVRLPVFSDKASDTVNWSVRDGYIRQNRVKKDGPVVVPPEKSGVLKVDIVDVQQGDGVVIETPDGKVVLVDGGDNKLFARYLASRFPGTTIDAPKIIDLMLVTHGDADHFAGLMEIIKSEKNAKPAKRLFIHPARVYHNGLVKRPEKIGETRRKDVQMLGATKTKGNTTYLVGLEEDLLSVPDVEMDSHFKSWKRMLMTYASRASRNKLGAPTFKRIALGDNKAFAFLSSSGVKTDVLGPMTETLIGKPALKFLGTPPKGPRLGHESLSLEPMDNKSLSASHTINGHSIVFRLSFGGFSFLFCGDLNDEASRILAFKYKRKLRSTVFKVPHHGSGDFSGGFFQAVAPVISVVSSGDENTRKEYIHPRATLMGALGKHSSVPEPLVLCTELVAFFQVEDMARLMDRQKDAKRGPFFAFSRTSFGIVKFRTDGKQLLVYTNSGNVRLKEAYVYSLDANGVPVPAPVMKT